VDLLPALLQNGEAVSTAANLTPAMNKEAHFALMKKLQSGLRSQSGAERNGGARDAGSEVQSDETLLRGGASPLSSADLARLPKFLAHAKVSDADILGVMIARGVDLTASGGWDRANGGDAVSSGDGNLQRSVAANGSKTRSKRFSDGDRKLVAQAEDANGYCLNEPRHEILL